MDSDYQQVPVDQISFYFLISDF